MIQIGRKIYFDKLTGNVLTDTGERMGNVRTTTLDGDFAAFSQLQSKDPSTVGVIQLGYGERVDEFMNMGSMKVIDDVLNIYLKLTIQTDKVQIRSDGIDTATITSDYAETFSVDDGEDYAVNPFQFASNVAGTYTITAKSSLHGQSSLTIEVV
jgi:hypothetical protein